MGHPRVPKLTMRAFAAGFELPSGVCQLTHKFADFLRHMWKEYHRSAGNRPFGNGAGFALSRVTMKQIRLSGREGTVIRSLGFGLGMNGTELQEHTRLSPEDLVDVLNGLMVVGYVECTPFAEETNIAALPKSEYEVNSAYSHELKAALGFGKAKG